MRIPYMDMCTYMVQGYANRGYFGGVFMDAKMFRGVFRGC